MKLEKVDALLEALAQEYNVPKPRYEIWLVRRIKKANPIKTNFGGTIQVYEFPFNRGFFRYAGRIVTILVGANRQANMGTIIHEFLHYKRYVERGYKLPEDFEEEERMTKRETRQYLKKLKEDAQE